MCIRDRYMGILYIYCFHRDNKAWIRWSMKAFKSLPRFIIKTLPMALTMYVEWLAFEIMTFICSYLGEFEMAVFTSYVNVLTTWYMIPLALSITFGTKIGNAIGAFQPDLAMKHIKTGLATIIMSIAVTASITFIFSRQIARFFSEDKDVIQEFVDTSVVISMYVVSDGFSCAFSNILRTIGAEKFALKCYVGCYIFGIGLGTMIVFVFKIFPKGAGLLLGAWIGVFVFVILGFYKIFTVNLEDQCSHVKKNLSGSHGRSLIAAQI
eukprot:TRINITY_DN8850_c0_g1_i4.p1 TRINITY_DN8850_c0_g1~~TRINITY_DN8850_c0_g1_i4.p1  ORF type:complete len:282 (-),score=32.87 TRINITY_DN8850_c0_g1_i4:29-826(-)